MHLNWVDKRVKKEKNQSMRIAIILTLTVAVLLIASPVLAESQGLQKPIESENFQQFLAVIISFLFWLGLALAPVFILISAFYFLTAAGNPTQIETGKRIITYTIIGLLVIIMARGAVEFIQRLF